MSYIVIDPAGEYPAEMIEFLGQTGRDAVAVYTDMGNKAAFEHMFQDRLGRYVSHEYAIPQWGGDLRAMAANIYTTLGGEVEGIIPWDERSIQVGAYLGEMVGAGWNSTDVIHRCRNKYAMKAHLRAHGDIRVNASQVIHSLEEAGHFLSQIDDWPVVVKPTEGSGTLGVRFAWSEQELVEGCVEAMQSGQGDVLLEEYVGGTEMVVNGVVDARGDLLVTDVWAYDKRHSHGYDNLYYQTIKLSTSHPFFWPAAQYAGAVVERLGLRRAPIHMELKMDDWGPCLIEVGARLSGGSLPNLASNLHGRSLFELAACHYLADLTARVDDLDYGRYDSFECRHINGIQTHDIEQVSRVHGVDAVRNLPSFHGFGKLPFVGAGLPMTTDMYTRSYEVYLIHHDAWQIEQDVAAARQLLQFE